MVIARLKILIWELREIRMKYETGRCPLCLGEEAAKNILLTKTVKRKIGENLYEYVANG
jgi:hypothetical protein